MHVHARSKSHIYITRNNFNCNKYNNITYNTVCIQKQRPYHNGEAYMPEPDKASSASQHWRQFQQTALQCISLHKSAGGLKKRKKERKSLLRQLALKGKRETSFKCILGEGGGLAQGSLVGGLAGHQLTHLFSSPCTHDRRCLFPLCILRTQTGPRHAPFRRSASL